LTLIGKDATKLAKSLNEKNFVLLCRDLLSSKGHFNIRIMDGPGDGGRDIHSVTSDNEKFLTQCKYHQSPTSTCSSKDISELPMVAIKFGYKAGLFITNARISPQGKKEYIDKNPNLDLDFLDGDALISEILANPLLHHPIRQIFQFYSHTRFLSLSLNSKQSKPLRG
jgi:Restriction endonuclease